MAKSAYSPHVLILLMLLCFNADWGVKMANGQENKSWCVAKPSASDAELVENINYACDNVGDPCRVIQENGPCFFPTTLFNHASVVMNLYFQANGRNEWNCNFKNSALISTTDPSYGDCKYA